MTWTADAILSALDACCEHFSFPMLDNGYVYLAATRLALYRSPADWALTVEVFGYSPRAGLPDTHIHTFGSTVVRQQQAADFASEEAHERYLAANPHNESAIIHPIEEGSWLDSEHLECVAPQASAVIVRGYPVALPPPQAYGGYGIALRNPPVVHVSEACRFLAATHRDSVLATLEERRLCIPAGLQQIAQIEEWHHPDLANGEKTSGSETFRQLAGVLESGDTALYRPTQAPNTQWSNWPEGGRL